MFYYHTRNDKEVDFVLRENNRVVKLMLTRDVRTETCWLGKEIPDTIITEMRHRRPTEFWTIMEQLAKII